MTQQEMEKEIKALAGTCRDLVTRLTALEKRVRQFEVDFYKDLDEPEEAER